jgi:Uma2 family endonuclease
MASPQPQPGNWTYDDLFSLPEDGKRYEITEGDLFEMPPSASAHAVVILNLLQLLGSTIGALQGWVLTAPLGGSIPGADLVEPNIVVLLPQGTARLAAHGV